MSEVRGWKGLVLTSSLALTGLKPWAVKSYNIGVGELKGEETEKGSCRTNEETREMMVIKRPFQNEKNEWCWSDKGKRVFKHQERKIKTQLEQVALHQKRYLFPLRPEGKTKLGGGEGSFGRWSKKHL